MQHNVQIDVCTWILFADRQINFSLTMEAFQTLRTNIRTFLCKTTVEATFFLSIIPLNRPYGQNIFNDRIHMMDLITLFYFKRPFTQHFLVLYQHISYLFSFMLFISSSFIIINFTFKSIILSQYVKSIFDKRIYRNQSSITYVHASTKVYIHTYTYTQKHKHKYQIK